MEKFTFEEKLPELDSLLKSRKKKWTLTCDAGISYEDVCQIIRVHIYQKWDQWQQDRSFAHWANAIISNQITNILKTNYLTVAPPCSTCSLNQGNKLCGFTKSGEQSSECPSYKKWAKKKQNGYNIKLAESIDNEESNVRGTVSSEPDLNWDKLVPSFHKNMKGILSNRLYAVYHFLYIDNKSEEELAEVMGFKTSENGKTPGYRQIFNFKKEIMAAAKKVMEKEDLI